MPGMLWVDGETYGVRAVKANEHECDWGNDYWTYVVDYNRAKEAFTSAMNELQDIAPDHSLVIALGSRNNFRYSVYSKYKSNRVKQRKPAGLSDFYLWMQDHWPCQTYNGVEGDDVIGIGGLRQIVDGAHLHRGHGGGDIAVAGEHDRACFGTLALQRRDDVEAVAVTEPEVDDRKSRRGAADLGDAVGHRIA